MSTFRGLGEDGLFCYTPIGEFPVCKDNPTQVGRALAQLGIE